MLRVAGVAQRITPRAHLDRRAHPVVQPQRCQRRLKSTATAAALTASATLAAAAAAAAAGGEAYRCGRLPLVRAQLPRDVHLARVRVGMGVRLRAWARARVEVGFRASSCRVCRGRGHRLCAAAGGGGGGRCGGRPREALRDEAVAGEGGHVVLARRRDRAVADRGGAGGQVDPAQLERELERV